MRPTFKWVAVVLTAAFLAACSGNDWTFGVPLSPNTTADAMVKITDGKGHGSGVHLGQGYILTAAHVVGKNEKMEIKSSTGAIHEAEVLWVNKAHDIALLHIDEPTELGASNLSCRTPEVGEAIMAKGNPGNMEFITVWGKVAGSERETGPWRSVFVTDIATVPGQSGGPVENIRGEVIGITVGVMVVSVGFGGSLVGVGYAVPGSVICMLMGKTV